MRTCVISAMLFGVAILARAACPANVDLLRPAILQETGTPVAPICADVSRDNIRMTAILFSNNIGMRLVIADAAGQLLSTAPEVMFGHARALELIDLDRDGVPELMASGIAPHAVVYWAFRIDDTGRARVLRSNSSAGPITDPEILDLGPGESMLLLDVKEGSSPDDDGQRVTEWLYTPYTMTAGYLQADPKMHVLSFAQVRRERGKPPVETIDFAAENTSAQARITLLNGASDGHDRCSSGSISVNGIEVLSESSFSQQTYRKDVNVPVLTDNEVTAELRGGPDCSVTLLITQVIP